jgi:hypothetical protein
LVDISQLTANLAVRFCRIRSEDSALARPLHLTKNNLARTKRRKFLKEIQDRGQMVRRTQAVIEDRTSHPKTMAKKRITEQKTTACRLESNTKL